MAEETPQFTVSSLEPEVRALWKGRRLPPPGGVLGPKDGPLVRQLEGTVGPGDPPEMVAHRAVTADVDARHLLLSGRGVAGTLRFEPRSSAGETERIGPLLESLGVWTGGAADRPWDAADRHAGVQAIVARLAHREILAARDGPLRLCLSCRVPRTPERIIYQKEVGDTFLVRFPLQGTDPPVDALVWVDAPWRLLGASALLVHPDVPYAVVEYRHKGASALLLASHGSLARLRAWLPEVELEVREERPGREWVGRVYSYPLRHEFPIGGSLDPPAGTVQADVEVGDTGTGIVPLVPGHGPTDAEIADRLGIAGWPLLTPRGLLDPTLMHKYAGLDVETANEFVARDLAESGAVLARLRVVRGVPYCALCGHRMVWTPGRAWCLEPARLPPEQRERYGRLLPNDRPLAQIEISRWPVSETTASTDPEAVALLECARCERLESPEGPIECPCGGTRRRIARRLLPSVAGAFVAWARQDPLPRADAVRIYANERRRVPALVHQLTAMSGIDGVGAEVGLTLVPTVARIDLAALLARHGADAARAAFVRTAGAGGSTTTFEERCGQEAARFALLYEQAAAIVAQCPPETLREGSRPPDAAARDLEVEDRAILARWARSHLRVLAAYDRWEPAAAHRQLFRFLERELPRYLEMTRPRLASPGTPATKRAALRTLAYLFRSAAVALAPIAPFTAEAIHRRLLAESRSLFETTDLAADRGLASDDLSAAWDRWETVIDAADGFRRSRQLAPETALPLVAIVLPDEESAGRLRADRATLERLARIARLEVTSPQVPWTARQLRLVPVEAEIQRAYPSLASQIVHLLERMPPRRSTDAPGKELTVFVHGVPRTITPEMVSMVDTLPDGFAPTPFGPGEMYVRSTGPAAGVASPPPLSPDAYWLVRRVRRRLAGTPAPDGTARVAIVVALDPLAAELKDKAAPIAEYLGLQELRVVGASSEAAPLGHVEGRTRTGAHWSVSLPGVPGRRRTPKRRTVRSNGRRVPPPREAEATGEVDYADEKVIAREESIRELGRELDLLLAAPILGPAKVTIAWDAGLHSIDDYQQAPFERIEQIAGFGRPVASSLWARFGRPVPPAPARRANAPLARPPAQTRPRAMVPSPPARESSLLAAVEPPPLLTPPEAAPEPLPPAEPSQLPAVIPGEPVLPAIPSSPDRTSDSALPAPVPAPAEVPEESSEEVTAPPAETTGGDSLPEPDEPAVPAAAPPTEAMAPDERPTDAPDTTEAIAMEPSPEPELDAAGPAPLAPEVPVAPASETPPPLDTLPSEATAAAPTTDVEGPVNAPPEAPEGSIESPPAASEAAPGEAPATEPEPIPALDEDDSAGPTPSVEAPIGEVGSSSPGSEPSVEPAVRGEVPERSELPTVEAPTPTEPGVGVPAGTEESTALAPAPELPPVDAVSVPPEPSAEAPAVPEVDAGETRPVEPTPEAQENRVEPVSEILPDDEERTSPASEELPATPEVVEASGSPAEEIAARKEESPAPPEAPLSAALEVPSDAGPQPPAETANEAGPVGPIPELPPASPEPSPLPTPSSELVPPLAPVVPEVTPDLATAPPPVQSPAPPTPVETAPVPAPPPPPPPPCGVEFDYSSALFMALQPFLDATAAGHKGIAIVRELPERIRVHIGPRPVEVFWMTNLDRPRSLRPSDLGALAQRVHRALDDDGVTAIFLEGVEYLVGVHGVERVSAFLREIDADARERIARVWVHITPSLISPADLDRLVGAVAPSSGSSSDAGAPEPSSQ